MKKRLLALIVVIAVCTGLCACGKNADKLSTKEDTVRLDVGKSHTIELEQGSVEDIKWSSDNATVATVSEDGTVTGKRSGVTVITGRTETGFVHVGVIVEGKEEYVDKNGNVVKVYNEPSNIVSITVGVKAGGKEDITVRKGDTCTLVAYTDPEGSKDKIDWKSDNTSIVTVSKDGVMNVVGTGKAKVIAYAPNGVKGEMVVRAK